MATRTGTKKGTARTKSSRQGARQRASKTAATPKGSTTLARGGDADTPQAADSINAQALGGGPTQDTVKAVEQHKNLADKVGDPPAQAPVTSVTAPNTVTDTTRTDISQPLMGSFATYTGEDADGVGTGDLLIVERVVNYDDKTGLPSQVICSQRHGGSTGWVTVDYADLKAQRTRNG